MMGLLNKEIIKNMKGRDMITLLDYSVEEIEALLDYAIEIKALTKAGDCPQVLKGKSLGMMFEKKSTRTRVSFEVGMLQLGGHVVHLNPNEMQLSRGEGVKDTAATLSEYLDGIMIRANSNADVMELAKHASIPIINGLTDIYHPCQALADILTVIEVKGSVKGLKLCYVGDGNNVLHSLAAAGVAMGMEVYVACPIGYLPDEKIIAKIKEMGKESGGKVFITQDPKEAAVNADVIYTDVWTSMGFEEEAEARIGAFADYQVNKELVSYAKDDYMFMHCLPAHREEEVTAEVIDGPNSYVYHEAGNRLHAQKAVLAALL
jgi:ornithine carbamoyltransferase